MAKRVMVVGAGGLLGSRLVPLLRQTAEVIALDRASLDLSQPINCRTLPSRIDAVMYLAQSNRYRDFPEGTGDVLRINVEQPLALVDYARKAGATHFVFASSGAVYGTHGVDLAEDAPVPASAETLGFYAASKLATEQLLLPFAAHLHVAVLRYFFIYGAGQAGSMLIPRLIASVRDGAPIKLQGRDGLVINPVHASDAARATAAALELNSSEIVNVAGGEGLSLRQIGEIAGGLLSREPQWETSDAVRPAVLTASIAKMSAILAAPEQSFESGISEMINEARGGT
jgi:nucleoside-diphosphate-sugar epimerase